MKIHSFSIAVLLFLLNVVANAQVTPQLGISRTLPDDYWGMNGANSINDGHGWNIINSSAHDIEVNRLSIPSLRYPGGTVANFWDWRVGYLMKYLPTGYSLPDNLQGKHDNYYDPAGFWPLGKPDNQLRQFKNSFLKNGGRPLFNLNINTSPLSHQLALLYHARELNLPVRYIELGNEFYLSDPSSVQKFADVSAYADLVVQWASQIKNDPNLGGTANLKIAAVGAISKANDPGRERLWLSGLLDNLTSLEQTNGQVIDAITLHVYGGSRASEFNSECSLPPSVNFESTMIQPEDECRLSIMLSQPFVFRDNLTDALALISAQNRETWITEYNLFDQSPYYVHGTWAHGLFVAAMTMCWLEQPSITKMNVHTLLGNATFSGVFADFGTTSGFENLGDFASPPSPVPATSDWQLTALGNALSMFGPAIYRSSEVTMIDFSGLSLPILHPVHTPNQPVLIGARFQELVPGTSVIRDEELILVNLGFNTVNIDGGGLLTSGASSITYQILEGDPFHHVTGNAVAGTISNSNRIGQDDLIIDGSAQNINNVPLPGYSITKIRALHNNPLTIVATSNSICTTPDPIEPEPCGQDISGTSFIISGGTPPYSLTASDPGVMISNPSATYPNIGYIQLPPGYSVSGATNITVEVTDAAAATSQTSVQVNETPDLVISGSTGNIQPCEFPLSTMCPGDSRTITASVTGAITYIWTPAEGASCTFCDEVTVTPSHSTDYTVYVSNGTCFVSNDADPIHLEVQPVIERITPQYPMLCTPTAPSAPDDHTLELTVILENPVQGLTYLWTDPLSLPLSTNSSCVLQAFDNVEGTYSVTVTSSSGCTAQKSIDVNKINCCFSTSVNSLNIFPGDTLVSNFITGGVFVDPIIYINGALHIDKGSNSGPLPRNFDIDNIQVYLGEDSRIIVDRDMHLNVIHGSIFENCNDDLWHGIQVSHPSNLINIDGSTGRNIFRDAVTALDLSNDARIHVHKNDFENNVTHISLKNYYNEIDDALVANSSPFQNNAFSCASLNEYGVDKSLHCIKLEHVEGITIGQATGGGNTFTQAHYGIHATNSNFSLRRNTFTEIHHFHLDNEADYEESAVYATGANKYDDRRVDIGGGYTTAYRKNWFYNNYRSITVFSGYHTTIASNEFLPNANPTIRNTDIRIVRNNSGNLDIFNNTFESFNRAISCYDIWRDITRYIPACVDSNDFIGTNGVTGNFSEAAIVVSDPLLRKSAQPFISFTKNTIVQARIGIFTRNIDKPLIGGNLFGNTIIFDVGGSQSIGNRYYGIWTQDCPGIRVVDNNISNPSDQGDLPGFQAIVAENCQAGFIQCNHVNSLSRGLTFMNNCELTIPRNNYFANYWHGIEIFDDQTIVPGAMGELIPGTSDYISFDNKWLYETPEDPNKFKIFNNNPVLFVDWYYQGPLGIDEPFYPLPANFGVTPVNTVFTGNGDCSDFEWTANREMSIGRVTSDSLSFPNSNESYQAKMNTFDLLAADSTILETGSPQDVPYQEFFYEMSQSNIGTFHVVKELLTDSIAIENASIINFSITDTNSVEYYRKFVNDVYLSQYQTGSISSVDSITLETIANGEASVYGDARYDALSLLGLESTSDVTSSGSRVLVENPLEHEENIFIHPNPSNHYFNISGINFPNVNIQIFDIRHNLVKSINNHSISRSVTIDKLSAGLYTVKLTSPDDSFIYLKLIVCQ